MYKEKIDAFIDSKREEMLRDLEMLVGIDSSRGEAREGKPFGEGPGKAVGASDEVMGKY